MSYKNLEIWQRAKAVSIKVHQMSLTLPRFELYETGSQIRRSSKSVRANIVEGYGRRKYKNEYVRFLIFSLASNDETRDHLEVLFETNSLKNQIVYQELSNSIDILGKQINRFIAAVERSSQKPETRN